MSYMLQAITDGTASERTLRDWGIDADSAVLERHSFEADVFSFTMASADALASDGVFVYGTQLRLRQDDEVVFIGTVRELPVFGAAEAERQRVTAYNYWYDLEKWIYQRHRRIMAEDFSSLGLVATSQIILGRDPATGAKITTRQEIENLCAYAALPLSPAFTGITPPFEQATDLPIATALRRMVGWQPNLLGHTSYAGGVAALYIHQPSTADLVAVDLTGGAPLMSIEGRVRRDLIPQGVLINYVTSVVDPATGIRYAKVVPDTGGAPTTGPYTMVVTMSVGDGENAPVGLAADYYAALSTPFVEGSLVIRSREADLSWRPGNLLSFANAPASWGGAIAPVVSVNHQLGSGLSTVDFGPPEFLPFASFAMLNAKTKDSRPPDPDDPPQGPGDGDDGTSGGGAGGTHDTGRTGRGGGGGTPATTSITHCVGGTQRTTLVLTA